MNVDITGRLAMPEIDMSGTTGVKKISI